jgi:hypothetical protein
MKSARGIGNVYQPSYRDRHGELKRVATWWIVYHVDGRRITENVHTENRPVAMKPLKQRLGQADKASRSGLKSIVRPLPICSPWSKLILKLTAAAASSGSPPHATSLRFLRRFHQSPPHQGLSWRLEGSLVRRWRPRSPNRRF